MLIFPAPQLEISCSWCKFGPIVVGETTGGSPPIRRALPTMDGLLPTQRCRIGHQKVVHGNVCPQLNEDSMGTTFPTFPVQGGHKLHCEKSIQRNTRSNQTVQHLQQKWECHMIHDWSRCKDKS